MARRTGGEAIVDGLLAHDVDTVFGLPGAQIYGLFDAFHRAGNRLRVIGARHEQGCGYMAFGYARAGGRPGVFSVVPGPGVLNAGAALLTAFGANEPVLMLTGEVPTPFLGQGRGHLHEMPDQRGTLGGFVKWTDRIEHPGQAGLAVARAFQAMRSHRPGPAAVEMPWDVFTRVAETDAAAMLPPLPPAPVDEERVAAAARLIADARAPMIFVGSGAIGAVAEIRALADRLGAPVVAFRSGRGIVPETSPLGLSIVAAYDLWPSTDLMIGIGTRLELPLMRWPCRPAGQRSIKIDIDPVEMRRWVPDVAVVADAAPAVAALDAAVCALGAGGSGRRDAIMAAKARAHATARAVQPQMAYLDALRRVLPEDGIVTDELCQAGFTMLLDFPVPAPRRFVSAGYQGTLGSGFPTALGAKVACPEQPVVAVCGDGGFMFAVQELATAVQYRINVVTLVFNNASYGNVRRDQEANFGGRIVASDLVNPDFVRLADSFGVRAERVADPDAFGPALERALAADAPALIEITIPRGSEASPWPLLMPPRPQASPAPPAA